MKFKIAAVALFCSVAMICSESNADLLGRMLGRGDCGGCQTVSSCCDTPAPVCGGRNFGMSININIGMPGRLFRGNNCGGGLFSGRSCGGGCGGGVVANIGDCGCAPAPAVADNCCGEVVDDGCGRRGCDLFGRLRGRLSNLGSCGNDCGCEAPAPTCGPTCGDTGCGCGGSGLFKGGLLGSLRGGMSGGCGCGSAPVADCGCNAPAPAMDCGCDDGCGGGLLSKCQLRGRLSGLFSRMKPSGCNSCGAPAGDCGCGSVAPVYSAPVADCGCGGGCDSCCGSAFGSRLKNLGQGFGSRLRARCSACGRSACDGGCSGGRLNLLSRFRGDRNSCDIGCSNSGCNGGCNSCAGGAVQYDGNSDVQPMQMQGVPTQAVPVMDQAPATNGAVEVPAAAAPEGAFYRRPVVDPSAFVIKK